MPNGLNNIRNFVIIAHIDHGKSTLADRFLELTGTVEQRKMHAQFLDQMELEQERGITIKMQPVRMIYHPDRRITQIATQNNAENFRVNPRESAFILNLIDTPGHVDFSYEVSRALAAVEGAILLVDATQGVQAQTIANLRLAQKEKLAIVPVINKIDLPSVEIEKTEEEIMSLLGVEREAICRVSAKEGTGVEELLKEVIRRVPAPERLDDSIPLRALIFDSAYDSYQGIVAHVRIVEGRIKAGDQLFFLATGAELEAMEVGVFTPLRTKTDLLSQGEIGYVATGIKEPEKVRVGDTITNLRIYTDSNADQRRKSIRVNPRINPRESAYVEPLPGYQVPRPVVFASVFPENQENYELLRESLKKLQLNDAALSFEPERSGALGRGFRAGFLGMLHMEIVAERLRREYAAAAIFSNPSVSFRIVTKQGGEELVYSAAKLPEAHEIASIAEPWALAEIVTPDRFLGAFAALIHERGGFITDTATLPGGRILLRFQSPLREIIVDFYDVLKSVSHGFASMAYELGEWRSADLARLNILIAGEKVPSFSEIVPREKLYHVARERVLKLKELLPRELFQISLQAEADGKIIARETIPAMKKDVTGHLYGGDRTRKMKLWKKQQRGKEKLKSMAHVEIPPDIFLKMLKK